MAFAARPGAIETREQEKYVLGIGDALSVKQGGNHGLVREAHWV